MRSNRNILLNTAYIVIGAVLLILSSMGKLDDMYVGFGTGLVVVAIIHLIRNIRYRGNVEYKEKVDIEVNDERNRYIRMKAWSWAGYMFVLIAAVISIVCMIISKTIIMQAASLSICLILVLYWVSYMILRKKY